MWDGSLTHLLLGLLFPERKTVRHQSHGYLARVLMTRETVQPHRQVDKTCDQFLRGGKTQNDESEGRWCGIIVFIADVIQEEVEQTS